MTKEEINSKIENLVEDYFRDNDEDISESYTILDSDGTSFMIDYNFSKNWTAFNLNHETEIFYNRTS